MMDTGEGLLSRRTFSNRPHNMMQSFCTDLLFTYVWGRRQRDFYNSLQAEIEIFPSHDVGIVQENFKARVINKNEDKERQRTMGKDGIVDMTEYDCRLYGFYVKMYFLVKGTILEQKKIKSDMEVIWCTHTHTIRSTNYLTFRR